MEITTFKLQGIGIMKDGQLAAIVIENGKPVHYAVKEMGNQDMEALYEVDKAQSV
jgi:hypothetical protein